MTPEEVQQFLEEEAEACKNRLLIIVEALERSRYEVPVFNDILRYLKFSEGSIKRARKIIKYEQQGREANQKRQNEQAKRKSI